jgi:hypothetical protein
MPVMSQVSSSTVASCLWKKPRCRIGQHPAALLAAAAERPAAGDQVAAVDGDGRSAAGYRGAGDDCVRAVLEDLLHARLGQAQGDQLANGVVAHVPAHRAVAFSERFHHAEKRQQVDLEATECARHH